MATVCSTLAFVTRHVKSMHSKVQFDACSGRHTHALENLMTAAKPTWTLREGKAAAPTEACYLEKSDERMEGLWHASNERNQHRAFAKVL